MKEQLVLANKAQVQLEQAMQARESQQQIQATMVTVGDQAAAWMHSRTPDVAPSSAQTLSQSAPPAHSSAPCAAQVTQDVLGRPSVGHNAQEQTEAGSATRFCSSLTNQPTGHGTQQKLTPGSCTEPQSRLSASLVECSPAHTGRSPLVRCL